MPLIHKPRDPMYGVRKHRKRRSDDEHRQRLDAAILRETRDFLNAMNETMSAGRLIDKAVKLYRERRHELKPTAKTKEKRVGIRTLIAADTKAYVLFMRSAMNPGELVDEAIRLYRQVNEHEETTT